MRSDDFNWFVSNYTELFKQYGRSFLIIRGRSVVDTAETPREAMDKAITSFPDGDYIIQFCDGSTTAYTNFISNWQLVVI